MTRYYAFYTWPYDWEPRRETFDTAEEVEAFYKKAMDNTSASDDGVSDYRNLIIIRGDEIKLAPAKIVEAWRIVEELDWLSNLGGRRMKPIAFEIHEVSENGNTMFVASNNETGIGGFFCAERSLEELCGRLPNALRWFDDVREGRVALSPATAAVAAAAPTKFHVVKS